MSRRLVPSGEPAWWGVTPGARTGPAWPGPPVPTIPALRQCVSPVWSREPEHVGSDARHLRQITSDFRGGGVAATLTPR